MCEDNPEAVVRRFLEVGWNSGDAASVGDIVADVYESNDGQFYRTGSDVPSGLERQHGAAALALHIGQYSALYDCLHFAIERMSVDADTVTTVVSPTGKSRDLTFTDRAGRERHFELKGEAVTRTTVVDGKVTRHDLFWARDPLFP
jgi:hypothetical protein